jgi:hypothetical protein
MTPKGARTMGMKENGVRFGSALWPAETGQHSRLPSAQDKKIIAVA